jgi:uncharacterized protein YgbK (DUF1537 family)
MSGPMTLMIVADDLTGACDTGALFTRCAPVPVTVHPQRRAAGDVAVIDTESRSLPAAEARTRVEAAVRSDPRPDLWFKKVDSTLRGPVTAEVDALMRQATAARALLCPAFPAQGRTVVGGTLLVDRVPVGDTVLARDPDFALGSSDIVAALSGTTARAVEWCSLDDLRGGRAPDLDGALVICDAETDADLDAIVRLALAARPAPLLVGSAGLAAALARRLGLAGEPPRIPAGLRWLIVAGSRHPATAEQLARVRGRRVRIITPPPEPFADARAVAADLARRARKAIETDPVDLVAVTGGDTAVALYRELDADRIDLLGAPLPGVALGTLRRGEDLALTVLTKAGGFGAPDLFARLMS